MFFGSDGLLYGTTTGSGGFLNPPTAFRLEINGANYSVIGNRPGGTEPWGELVEGCDGWLCGTTYRSVFRLTRDGGMSEILHLFADDSLDGFGSQAGLIRAGDGTLFGATGGRGSAPGFGTVFKVLAPFLSITRGLSGVQLQLTCGGAMRAYDIEAAAQLNPPTPWQVVGSATTDVNGFLQSVDSTGAAGPFSIYHVVSP